MGRAREIEVMLKSAKTFSATHEPSSGSPSHNPNANQPLLCSINEATKLLGIGRTSIYSLLNSGDLESIQIGTRRLVKVDSIKAFIENASGGAA